MITPTWDEWVHARGMKSIERRIEGDWAAVTFDEAGPLAGYCDYATFWAPYDRDPIDAIYEPVLAFWRRLDGDRPEGGDR